MDGFGFERDDRARRRAPSLEVSIAVADGAPCRNPAGREPVCQRDRSILLSPRQTLVALRFTRACSTLPLDNRSRRPGANLQLPKPPLPGPGARRASFLDPENACSPLRIVNRNEPIAGRADGLSAPHAARWRRRCDPTMARERRPASHDHRKIRVSDFVNHDAFLEEAYQAVERSSVLPAASWRPPCGRALGPSGSFRPAGQILDRELRDREVFHIGQRLEKRNDFRCSLQLQNFYNEVLDTRRPGLI